ncbi:uncharacterized protein LOC120275303 isoform X2 [Dioscorea cayenensis subsp. rotundata]|uniref:Uncharacterized protein LOC120275303 isoform X2 n=1 Tax=Dioscorea cayennensis subsp. rotundata TaxID=55577 RepID=A0AB40CDA4_DIOCR|nr:uncharacterized protein LOC120275303 isoform X2 [Dioscorea cayenensis subsp. rotundata]
MKPKSCFMVMAVVMFFVVYKLTKFQQTQEEMVSISHPFDSMVEEDTTEAVKIGYLPQGIIESQSDLELKPLWLTKSSNLQKDDQPRKNLLAMAVGIKQKKNVDDIVNKFFSENFTVILFHYDGNVNDWHDFEWSDSAIHIVANHQTKWWFAKRFMHPDVVSAYDYIFLWDEDLGIDNFHPGRYLKIVESERLDISQPALDPSLSEVHHRITIRRSKGNLHRFVEGMAPVFSRPAWRCVWHLIQNDLIHGWGIDYKLGYCAQGDRTKRVGVIDSEYVVHQGVKTLGGFSEEQNTFLRRVQTSKGMIIQNQPQKKSVDQSMHRIKVRKQATLELQKFQDRWDRAIKDDENWVDPFQPHEGGSEDQVLAKKT